MKLQQDMIWKKDGHYVRIVRLERLSVEFKAIKDLITKEGTRHEVSKKEFCRFIKTATPLSPADVKALEFPTPPV